MPSISEKTRQKQLDIVLAAETLFLKQGFRLTSVDQVAAKAGATKQTVYRYFPSKVDLFTAVMKRIQSAEFNPHVFGDGSLKDEVFAYGSYLLSFHLQEKALGMYRLMLTEGNDEALFQAFKNQGPGRVLKPLIEYLTLRYKVSDAEFYSQILAAMILAPRAQLLMKNKKSMKKIDQKIHVEKVTEMFVKIIEA